MSYVIYKIIYQEKVIYIGSTKRFFRKRKQHKNNCYNDYFNAYNKPVYKFIRDTCKWEDLTFEIIEEIEEYNDAKEIKKIERDYICLYKETCLNRNTYNRPKIECDKHKQYMKEYNKQYQRSDKYKQYMKEYNKRYYQSNKSKST